MPISTIDHLNDITQEINSKQTKEKRYSAAFTAEHQGMAAFIAWMKAVRLANLLHEMEKIELHKANALDVLKALTKSVEELIASNRGGDKGIHGFIGERAQVYIKNARALINGFDRICELIDDNGMVDYLEDGIAVQQKACRSGMLGLDQLLQHKEKYPEFEGIGHIPKDFYEIYKRLEDMSQVDAGKLSGYEWKFWLEIQKVKAATIDVKPMICTYDEIQKDRIYNTIEKHEIEIQKEAEKQVANATETHRPTFQEGVKATATSAVVEGVMSGVAEVISKRHNHKRIKDYDKNDIKDIGMATLKGSGKGAIRGTVVYTTANFTSIPTPVAGAAVTIAFDTVSSVKKCIDGKINSVECAVEIGKTAFVASAGALGAKLGGKLIQNRIVGEVVGGFVFSFIADKSFGWVCRRVVNNHPVSALPCCV